MIPHPTLDLAGLGMDEGAHLLVARTVAGLPPGAELEVTGRSPALAVHVAAWGRARGHRVWRVEGEHPTRCRIEVGAAERGRWTGARRAGGPGVEGIVGEPDPTWGLAARGALVEAGEVGDVPPGLFDLRSRDVVWADIVPRLYAQAAASQWDPATAIDWGAAADGPGGQVPDDIEGAVVQIMTYLVENEQAALVIPARLLGRIHPHFREVVALLAVQVADEARHVEVFSRRAASRGQPLGTSSAGGRMSLSTLLREPDFALASFLLSVLGEGTFLSLLGFLDRHAPDPVTRQVCRLARQDEARHVAFGVAHLERHAERQPELRGRLRAAVERRHDSLAHTAGLNQDVLDSLVVLAAGEWTPEAVGAGFRAVQRLQAEMDEGRRHRLERIGFTAAESAEISGLHTRNFM
ncbi:ferritin-like domain-containing protein [Parafrankia elaeagni]|uniref:ferritin-like domain-containing protein n=1 Tax=Parafrankia elaeagni TaxID=222534 RepID=UPI0003621960|nr:ferritin-like domain-containing protein [Parafrankia elaeagni]